VVGLVDHAGRKVTALRAARRRPRVRSVRFRGFAWLVTREAALRVLWPYSLGAVTESKARRLLRDSRTYALRVLAERWLVRRPDRQQYP